MDLIYVFSKVFILKVTFFYFFRMLKQKQKFREIKIFLWLLKLCIFYKTL